MARFDASQLGNLDPTEIAGFDASQLGNLDPTAMAGFDVTQLGNLDPTAMAGFDATQFGNLDPTAMAGFDATQLGNLDPTAMAGFDASQLGNLDPTAMAGFDVTQLGNLDPTAMAGFDATQLGNLDPSAMAGFSSSQISNVAPTAMSGITSAQISNIDPAAIAGFDKSLISNLDPAAVGGFAASQISMLGNDAVAGLDSDKIAGLVATTFSGFDSDQISNIDPTALRGIEGQQIENMTPESFRGFIEDKVGFIPVGACPFMSGDQIDEMDHDAVGGFTNEQFEFLTPEARAGFDRDDLGGLSDDVVQNMNFDDLASLNSAEIVNMPNKDFAKLATNLQDPTITADAVADLLPAGWAVDTTSDELTAPPGASLVFRSIDQTGPDDGTTLPSVADFSRSLSVGGKVEDDNVLRGLDTALGSVGVDGVGFRQSADGILRAVSSSDETTQLAAFIPDDSGITQAPAGFEPGLVADARGAFVLTTDKGYQIPLLPAPRDPDAMVALLPGATVSVGSGGETTITAPEGDPSAPITGKFNPVLESSDLAPGLHRTGSGSDATILMVYGDGSAQQMLPAMQSETEFGQAASAIPGVEAVDFNTDGSIDLRFQGSDLILRPAFDIAPGTATGTTTPALSQEGDSFFFTNSNGDRQEFFVT